jgi:hypothetical protein
VVCSVPQDSLCLRHSGNPIAARVEAVGGEALGCRQGCPPCDEGANSPEASAILWSLLR